VCAAENKVMTDLFRAADAASLSDVPVVIFGDEGGKSGIADYIRRKRGRASIVVEAGALPLDEQELLLAKLGAVPVFIPPLGDELKGVPMVDEDRTLKAASAAFKKAFISRILAETSWNQTKAAKILGIQRTYLSRLVHELGIRK
jgi:DNA-binding NtrC family response regulator